jgi:lysozyme
MNKLTAKQVAYLAHSEGLVLEAYKDNKGIWTWALGVTNNSGHQVYPRYKDKPQSIEKCIEVSEWLMREKYLPMVLKAFDGKHLTEGQIAAALSFNWNTGAINTTGWVDLFLEGHLKESEKFMRTHYLNGGDLQSRRDEEADLFFREIWPDNLGQVNIWNVAKPSYTPKGAKKINLLPVIQQVLGGN